MSSCSLWGQSAVTSVFSPSKECVPSPDALGRQRTSRERLTESGGARSAADTWVITKWLFNATEWSTIKRRLYFPSVLFPARCWNGLFDNPVGALQFVCLWKGTSPFYVAVCSLTKWSQSIPVYSLTKSFVLQGRPKPTIWFCHLDYTIGLRLRANNRLNCLE